MALPSEWKEHRAHFEAHGYAVIPNFVAKDDLRKLRIRAALLMERHVRQEPIVWGAPASQTAFLESARGIEVFESNRSEMKQIAPSSMANVVKMGHALHDLDPVFDQFSRQDSLRHLICGLGYQHPLLIQSLYLPKPPGLNEVVDWHQDATFLHTQPQRVLGLWFAIDDANRANGCLWVLPGSHHTLARRWLRRNDGTFEFADINPNCWPNSRERGIPLEVCAGTLICLHDHVFHRSDINISEHYRQSYALHLMDGSAQFGPQNWLQPPQAGFRGF